MVIFKNIWWYKVCSIRYKVTHWETQCYKKHQHENNLLFCKSSHCHNVTHVNRETSQLSYVSTSVNPVICASGENHMKTPLEMLLMLIHLIMAGKSMSNICGNDII